MWKVLVVDDNFVNRKLLLEVLKGKAMCDVAVNGKEAIEAYAMALSSKKPYQAILLDIVMPEMNGLEVLNRIRQHEQKAGILLGTGIPIIMITAHAEPFLDGFNMGCDDYMLKPIDGRKLVQKLKEKINK